MELVEGYVHQPREYNGEPEINPPQDGHRFLTKMQK